MANDCSMIDDLITWSSDHGSYLDPRVEIYIDPLCGFSFQATKDILADTRLVSCSYRTTLSYLNTQEAASSFQLHGSVRFSSSSLQRLRVEAPHIIGHYFLSQQYLMGRDSFWWSYIRMLPQPDQLDRLGNPMWWPEEDRLFLQGTNVEPGIKARLSIWEHDWRKGSSLVDGFENQEAFNYHLYQWAATIFDSRSFRASLTIPCSYFRASKLSPEKQALIPDQIRKDSFSVLLPIMDIGNHNGIDHVHWSQNETAGHISLVHRKNLRMGCQIYNYYGNKSNSELLVAYGFILPSTEQDTVNLKICPHSEAFELRRRQACYLASERKPQEQEFMFQVLPMSTIDEECTSVSQELQAFSPGLIDTLLCMVANKRERRFLAQNLNYCVEKDSRVFQGPLGRNFINALYVLHCKLQADICKLQATSVLLGNPQNSNQRLAYTYRNRQLDVRKAAVKPLSARLTKATQNSTLWLNTAESLQASDMLHGVKLASLECAYEWLKKYPVIYEQITSLIADDQQEPLPLDWAVLAEDWDHTYWTVWLYIVCKLRDDADTNIDKLSAINPILSTWLMRMKETYLEELFENPAAADMLYAEKSEISTINSMIWAISGLDLQKNSNWEHTRNFASYVAREETVVMPYRMKGGALIGKYVEQRILCISKC